jgi:hypothetical protein
MCDFFQLNFFRPSYKVVKKANKKGVQFVHGEHVIFKCVAKIYKEAKRVYNIGGPISVILVEDETKVKSRVSWDSRGLIGFCGVKENHCCVINFNRVIGIGEVGYNNVLEGFTNNKIVSFCKSHVVNPLHGKLPRSVLVVCCTCNCFNVSGFNNNGML